MQGVNRKSTKLCYVLYYVLAYLLQYTHFLRDTGQYFTFGTYLRYSSLYRHRLAYHLERLFPPHYFLPQTRTSYLCLLDFDYVLG
jgi:hypothetical protein